MDKINEQLIQNMRHYSEMRFKQLTLLLAWFTIVGAALFLDKKDKMFENLGFSIDIFLANASLIICSVLWIMEIRSTMYWAANREKITKYWPRPNKSKMKFMNATNAVLIFYISIYSFWTWYIFKMNAIFLVKSIAIFVGALLLTFSILNYQYIWKKVKKP